MSRFQTAARCLLSISIAAAPWFARQSAADDLAVLPEAIDGAPVRTMMQRRLAAQTGAAFKRWRTSYELLKTHPQIEAYQDRLKSAFVESIGGFPNRTPLNPQITGTIPCAGFRIEKVLFESQPQHVVSANFYLPDPAAFKPPYPGVLVVCGHSNVGKGYEMYARAAALCALNGMAALVVDPIEQGERIQWLDDEGKERIRPGTYGHTVIGISAALLGQNTARFEIWDAMRAIDYLQSRSEVDGDRIGVTGNSGGGTQTSYLMALDERVDAAAPSCYLTGFERLLATIGPQDAEQNIFGQLAWGMDHADYVLMRAPRPTLICAATHDFFDIDGTWNLFRDAKRLYTRLGAPDRVAISEVDEKHGFHQASREAAVRFLALHLREELRSVAEPEDLTVPAEKELWTTADGQVIRLEGARSVYDLMADDLARLAASRTGPTPDLVRGAAGFPPLDDLPRSMVEEIGTVDRATCTITKLVFRTPSDAGPIGGPELLLPALLFEPPATRPLKASGSLNDPGHSVVADADAEPAAAAAGASPAVLYVHEAGKLRDAAPGGPIEQIVQTGRTVLAVDVRGTGETFNQEGKFYHQDFGTAGQQYMTAYLLGRSYVGMRAADLLVAARWLREHVAKNHVAANDQAVDLVAIGHVGVPALHAAVAEPALFGHVRTERTLDSWASLIENRAHKQQLVNLVHGVLAAYDLPDLRAALGDSLTAVTPLDPLGDPIEE